MALKTDEVIEQIKRHDGNLAAVSRALGVTRQTLYNFLDKHPKAKEAREESRETMLDEAESVLYRKVREGSTAELIFYLKTQGRSRGYIEKSQIEHSGSIDVRSMSDDELRAIVES